MKKLLIAIGALIIVLALIITLIVCIVSNGDNDNNDSTGVDDGANTEESLTEWYDTDEIVFPEIPW